MPGLSIVCDFEGRLRQKASWASTSLNSVMHYENYEKRILSDGDFCCLAWTGYKEYPLACIESEKYLIYLEGRIYGNDDDLIRREINRVAEWLSSPSPKMRNIASWLLDTDGEFVLCILDKISQSVWFVNDALGRLPVYFTRADKRVIISREFRFIAQFNESVKFDSMGVAQYLLFGYPLGKRTLLDNVHRLPPASVTSIDIHHKRARIVPLHDFNFEVRQHPIRPIDENTAELVKLFSEACLNRSHGNNRILVGLSGGLDSRTVAVGLQNNDIPFSAITRLDSLGASSSDAAIAEELAKTLGIDWKLIRLEPTLGRDLLNILRMKNGLSYLGIASIMTFFEKIRQEYGAGVVYFTGDGGDKVLRDLRPCWKLKNMDGLVKFILSRNQQFSLPEVAAVTRIPAAEILEELKSLVASFPEGNWSQKYVHFLMAERGFKLLFEGEDKNRLLFWSVSPFYSIRFFKYAMECPDKQKEKFALHRNLLLALSPDAAAVTYANWGVPLSDKRYLVYLFMRSIIDRIPPRFKRSVKGFRSIMRGQAALDSHRACLRDELNTSLAHSKYLNAGLLGEMAQGCNKSKISILLTIASAIEQSECGQSTLSKYDAVQFG